MDECQWIKPVLVGQFEFTEWTLRKDKKGRDVVREV